MHKHNLCPLEHSALSLHYGLQTHTATAVTHFHTSLLYLAEPSTANRKPQALGIRSILTGIQEHQKMRTGGKSAIVVHGGGSGLCVVFNASCHLQKMGDTWYSNKYSVPPLFLASAALPRRVARVTWIPSGERGPLRHSVERVPASVDLGESMRGRSLRRATVLTGALMPSSACCPLRCHTPVPCCLCSLTGCPESF